MPNKNFNPVEVARVLTGYAVTLEELSDASGVSIDKVVDCYRGTADEIPDCLAEVVAGGCCDAT